MAHLDIKFLFKHALERLKDSEKVGDDDPSMEHLTSQVVRSIAELEVSHLGSEARAEEARAEDQEPPTSAAA